MSTYILTVAWVLSNIFCIYIAKIRHVNPTLTWRLFAVILGPLAIPLVFFAKPEKPVETS